MHGRRHVAALLLVVVVAGVAPSALAGGHPPDPNDPRNLTWMEEGVLALGGGGLDEEGVRWLHAQGFGAVANFRAEHEDPEGLIRDLGMEFLDMPVDHAVNMNATMLAEFVAWAERMQAEGRPMYVHCTNGWHRAAVFAAAWLMAKEGLGADEAFERVRDLRGPWAINRAPSALLTYEARLTGEPALAVLMLSPLQRPDRGGEMPVTVEVLAQGRPLPGAEVRFWTEESKMRLEGTTDEKGRFALTYRAPGEAPVDHLYARASAPGFLDGADDVELFFEVPVKTSRQLDIDATPHGSRLDVKVTREGRPVHAHVLAWSDDGWAVLDESGTGELSFQVPPETRRVHLRAEAWGDQSAEVALLLPKPRGHERYLETTPTDYGDPEPPARGATPPPRVHEGPPAAVAEASPLLPLTAAQVRAAAYGVTAAGAFGLLALGTHAAVQRVRATRGGE